jgi:2-keto-4-pentenoate hydratase
VEGLTQEQIRQEARQLYQAEKDKSVLRPFTEKYPKIAPEESYRIQLALIEMKKADCGTCRDPVCRPRIGDHR